MKPALYTLRGVIVLLLACVCVVNAATRPPNIIFILADDLGINDLACYGRKDHHTPNLDRLAEQGTRFTSAYCAQSICSPSRAAILTGKAPARLHLTTYLPGRADAPSQKVLHPEIRQQLPLEEVTLAEHLKKGGYTTAYVGKWHLGGKGFLPTDQGFDFYHPGSAVTKPSVNEGGKGEYDLTRQAIAFIETNQSKPFFLYLAHNSPHIPFSAKSNLVAKNVRALDPVYAAVIESLDDTVGVLMNKLDALGLTTNTIVIFTSDNGGLHVPEGGHKNITHNTPFRAGKGFLYEGGLRIPLIVRWPGSVPAKRVVDAPVINTDWLPTLSELTRNAPPSDVDGVSFARVLLGKADAYRKSFFWHFPHYTNQGSRPGGALRDGDWKLIEYYDTGAAELFHVGQDVTEKENLAAREPKRVAEMRANLAAWRNTMGAQINKPNPVFEESLFRDLYETIDPTRYNASLAGESGQQRMLAWRRQMNAVLNKPKK